MVYIYCTFTIILPLKDQLINQQTHIQKVGFSIAFGPKAQFIAWNCGPEPWLHPNFINGNITAETHGICWWQPEIRDKVTSWYGSLVPLFTRNFMHVGWAVPDLFEPSTVWPGHNNHHLFLKAATLLSESWSFSWLCAMMGPSKIKVYIANGPVSETLVSMILW